MKEKGFEGTARFVGTTDFAPGYWIGVELPHAGGKNDGSVKGKVCRGHFDYSRLSLFIFSQSYFACPESHGLFVRPHQLDAVLPEDVPSWLRVGVSVRVRDKDLEGHVRFIGSTLFAPGTWVGVELPNAAGKNNGTVKGKASYMYCILTLYSLHYNYCRPISRVLMTMGCLFVLPNLNLLREWGPAQSQVRRGLVFPYPGHHLEKERSLHLVGNLQKRDGSLDPSNHRHQLEIALFNLLFQ